MNDHPLTVTYSPVQSRYNPGSPVRVRIDLKNNATSEIEILAAGVPWTFHHAVRFTVSEGAEEGVTFENRLWVLEPPAAPDLTIGSGEVVSGEVDLAQYLYTGDGRNIGEIPGRYGVRAHLSTFVLIKKPGEETQTLHIDSEPFTIIIGE